MSYCLHGDTVSPGRVVCGSDGAVSSATLDYMLTNFPAVSCNFGVFCGNIADHLVSSLIITSTDDVDRVINKTTVTTRSLSETNLSCFRRHLAEFKFELIYSDDIDYTFERFHDIYLYYYDMCCPRRLMRPFAEDNVSSWITMDIVTAGKKLKDMYWLMVRAFPELRGQYNNLKKDYKTLINNTKKGYISCKIANSKNRVRALWGCINQQLGKKKQNKSNFPATLLSRTLCSVAIAFLNISQHW